MMWKNVVTTFNADVGAAVHDLWPMVCWDGRCVAEATGDRGVR